MFYTGAFWIDDLRSTKAIVAIGKGAAKLHVSGNYISTRGWKNVLDLSCEERPPLRTDSLAWRDSHRLAAAAAKFTSWLQVLLELRRDWTQHEIYAGGLPCISFYGPDMNM
jgi:hypothetical protein